MDSYYGLKPARMICPTRKVDGETAYDSAVVLYKDKVISDSLNVVTAVWLVGVLNYHDDLLMAVKKFREICIELLNDGFQSESIRWICAKSERIIAEADSGLGLTDRE